MINSFLIESASCDPSSPFGIGLYPNMIPLISLSTPTSCSGGTYINDNINTCSRNII